MVYFNLLVSCDCENVANLAYSGTTYEWHLTIRCTSCGTTAENEIYFTGDDEQEVPDSRGHCNLLMKCKACKTHMTLQLVVGCNESIPLSNKVSNAILASFECRGAEPIAWNSQGLQVKAAESGTTFEDCDLTDTWYEYDEPTGKNCTIENFHSEFVRGKSVK